MKFLKEEDISKKDLKKLQRMTRVDSDTADRIKSSLDSSKKASKDLASGGTRISQSGQSTRTRPSARPKVTDVDPTNLNKFIRGEADKGRGVSQPLRDTAGVRDAARRGDIKAVQAGGSKPTAPQGRISKVRLKGDLAASGVDTSPAPSRLNPRGRRLADTTKGGPVKVTTLKPSKPAPAPKPQAVTKPVPTLSKRGALSKKVDPILKDLRRQGASQKALETRMSAGYDKNLKATADKVLKQIQGTKGVSQADVSRKQQEFRTKYKETQLKNKVKPQTKAKVKALLPDPWKTSKSSVDSAKRSVEVIKTPKPTTTKLLPYGSVTVQPSGTPKKAKVDSFADIKYDAKRQRIATMKKGVIPAAPFVTPATSVKASTSTVKAPKKIKLDPKKVKQRAKRINALRQYTVRSPLGRMRFAKKFATGGALLDAGIGTGLEWYNKSQANKAAGGSGALSTKDKARAILRGVAGATGYAAGATLAAPIAALPVPGARPAAIATGMYTGSKASDYPVKQADRAFDASYDTIAGATKWQKKEMEKINRKNQGAGVSAQQASFKKGDKAIIRDAGGKERIGYAAKLTGKDGVTKTVYKHANDPKAQRYTSSSPLERIGRALMPGRYAAKDEAARKKRVADFKKAALATEQYFTFLHITESMIAQGYDAEFIEEFWGWEDVKQVEFVNSLDLTEDIFIPDEEFLTEGNDLSEGLVKWIDRMIRRMKTRKVPTPTQTASGRPITSSGTKVTPTDAKVTSSGSVPLTGSSVTPPKQTPKLADKVKTVLRKPGVRNAGLTAAGAGLVTLGGKLALDNNIIPGIPDSKDSDADPKDPKEVPAPKGPKGPVLTGPDGKPVQFPPLTPPPPVPKSREVLRPGHWRAINDPPQFHRDPALADYRNIRATKRR